MNPMHPLCTALIRSILLRPFDFTWSVQGFGMLRTYFEKDKMFRLNIWDSALSVPNVSTIHDHPWDFRSYIIAGSFTNIRYDTQWTPAAALVTHNYQKIKTGEGGGPVGAPGRVKLIAKPKEHYKPGDYYVQRAEEVHASFYSDGTVTVNDRRRRADGEHALVFWPKHQEWVDAEPREATRDEIANTTEKALTRFKELAL